MVASNWNKLINKLEKVEARKVLAKEKINITRANVGKNIKIDIPHEQNHFKGFSTGSGNPWKRKITKKQQQGLVNGVNRKKGIFSYTILPTTNVTTQILTLSILGMLEVK